MASDTAATIKIEVTADTTNAQKGLDSAGKAAGSFSDTFKATFGGVLSAGLIDKATSAIWDFGKTSVDAAANDAKAQAVLAQTLKNSAGATDAQVAATESSITAMSKHSAVADDDLRPALGNLVRATGDVTKSQDLLQIALDASAGTGKDLQSITLAMGKAAQGSTGGLSKLGIATKDASGAALTADQVFANMAKTFKGDAGVAADSAAGKMANAKIQFGEFQEQVGGYLIPVLAQLASFFTNTLLPAISGLADWVANNKDVILAAFIGFGTVVGAVVVPAFVAWAIAAGTAAIATLAAAAPFIAIGVAVAAVALVIIKNWDSILAALQFVWNWVSDNWPLLLAILLGPFGFLVGWVIQNWDSILNALSALWRWISANWPLLLDILLGPFGFIVGWVIQNWGQITAALSATWSWIKSTWSTIQGLLTAPFTAAFDAIKGAFNSLKGFIQDGVNAIAGMWDKMTSGIKGAYNAVARAWNAVHISVPGVSILGHEVIPGFDFGLPHLPLWARGAYLTSPTLGVLGEAGPEFAAPESLLRQLIRQETGRSGPAVVVQNATFASDIDVESFMRRVAWVARTEGL
jgi:hypothetical protein